MIYIFLFFFSVVALLLGAALYCYHEVRKEQEEAETTIDQIWDDVPIFLRKQAD